MENDWEKIGTIGVDSGLVWIGDPCYLIGSKESALKKWGNFCESLRKNERENEREGVTELKNGLGFGIGFAVSPGSDGEYPVFISRGKHGNITGLRVEFD